jgi:aryl-alcohol dehydrogenase-like predicted oxidoreductase
VRDGKDIARLSLRRILSNRYLTCTIPGMTSIEEMDNNFRAQAERRKLSKEENRILDNAITNHFTSLPRSYQWLRDWAYV